MNGGPLVENALVIAIFLRYVDISNILDPVAITIPLLPFILGLPSDCHGHCHNCHGHVHNLHAHCHGHRPGRDHGHRYGDGCAGGAECFQD